MRGSGWPGNSFRAQINRAHIEPGAPNYPNQPEPGEPILGVAVDELVKHYTYDGLGRLIRTQSPYPAPTINPQPSDGLRTERFYYDGVRRIQELVADPVETLLAATVSADFEVQSAAITAQSSQSLAADGQIDPNATPLAVEQLQLSPDPTPLPLPPQVRLMREYIWGPGDGPGGVDELLVQFDLDRNPWWVLQDAGGDIVALCDNANAPNAIPTGAPFVAAQWTFDAYGQVLSADHLAPHPFMHAGHKGLFFDRLDVGVADPAVPGAAIGASVGTTESPRLVPFAHSIYHNRNRAYNPQFGRFMQADPNASAMALLEGASFNGRGIAALAIAFDLSQRYGDGANLYEYLGSNPWNRSDPMGLSWDPFDMVDEIIAERTGSASSMLMALGNSAAATAVLAAQIATYLPFPGASLAGELALVALGEQDMQAALIAAGIGLIPGGKLLGPAFKHIGKFVGAAGAAAWGAAKHYAGKAGKFLWNHSMPGLMMRATKWLAKGCGCFEAGTEVWTANGLTPIDQLSEGDEVIAVDEATGELSLRKVVKTFVRKAAPIVAVTLMGSATPAHAQDAATPSDAATGLITLNTTEEHPFLVDLEGQPGSWVQAASLKPGDMVRTMGDTRAVVVAVHFTSRLATVYNLEVEGLHTYRVGPDGVVVHNTTCFRAFTRDNFAHNLGLVLPKPGVGYEAHHIIPHQFEYLFPGRNLNDPTNGAWVHRGVHRLSGGSITRLWETWLRNNPNPTARQVENFAREVENTAGIWMIRP